MTDSDGSWRSGLGSRWVRLALVSGAPITAAVLVSMLLLVFLGRDPIEFYGNVIESGLLSSFGLQESLNRAGPLLIISAGLVIAFKANVWHLGIDGCFLLAAVVVAGIGPLLYDKVPNFVLLVILSVVGALIGALWSAPPAYLKLKYGVNEIVTTLIMTSIGAHFAHFLVKTAFQDPTSRAAAQTRVLPVEERLPTLFGTRIHIGIFIGLAVILVTHYFMSRTPVGVRLQIMGSNLRAAKHFGFNTNSLGYLSFYLAGGAFGLAGGMSIFGDWGVVGEGWNPAWGFLLVPLVFLARKHAIGSIFFVAAFSVLSIGGELATREANLPNHFQLVVLGLILLFMTLSEWLNSRREKHAAHQLTNSGNSSLDVDEKVLAEA